jgi:hypothetical protein
MLIKFHSAHNAKFNTAAVSSIFLERLFKLLNFMHFHNAIDAITKYTLFCFFTALELEETVCELGGK